MGSIFSGSRCVDFLLLYHYHYLPLYHFFLPLFPWIYSDKQLCFLTCKESLSLEWFWNDWNWTVHFHPLRLDWRRFWRESVSGEGSTTGAWSSEAEVLSSGWAGLFLESFTGAASFDLIAYSSSLSAASSFLFSADSSSLSADFSSRSASSSSFFPSQNSSLQASSPVFLSFASFILAEASCNSKDYILAATAMVSSFALFSAA